MNKVAVRPVDVRIEVEPTVQLATLAELKEFIGLDVADADLDAQLTDTLAQASAWVQGPRSATGACFTDHGLLGEYASAVFDLLLPGGRVKGGTFPRVTSEEGQGLQVDSVVVENGSYYLRLAEPVDLAVDVRWTSAWGRVPPVVKGCALRVAGWMWSVRGNDPDDVDAKFLSQQRTLLLPWTLVQ